MQNAIKAERIVKKFGNFIAVNGISFQIKQGETFAILGENGAGKSTTMRMIACRSPLTSGELSVFGLNVKQNERQIRSLLGIVPQENNLDPDLNVRENLLVYAKYFRIPHETARKKADELLSFVGLNNKIDAKVDSLSGGMKRRLIIARSLIHNPKVLLLDEPTTGLDPSVRLEIWEKLEDLRNSKNITIVLSTHYMDEAEKLCQRLFIMAHGEIVLDGNPREIIQKRVKKFALEVRSNSNDRVLNLNSNIISQKRGNLHLYFAETTEELSHLMNRFESSQIILRPSNLEDVFLQSISKK